MVRRSLSTLAVLAALLVSAGLIQAAEPPVASSGAKSAAKDLADEPLRVSMEFQNVALKEILKAFSLQTGLNIIAAGDVGEDTMTLYLEDVTILDALDRILRAGDLTYDHPAGSDIFVVKRMPEQGNTITRIYRLKYARVSKALLTQSISAFGAVTPFEAAVSTSLATGSATPTSSGTSNGAGEGPTSGVDAIIYRLLTDQGSVVVDERTNSLIVTDVPENFPRIEAAIVALDTRTPQILVDVELVETVVGKTKDLGVEWSNTDSGDLLQLNPGWRTTKFPLSFLGGAGNVTVDPSTDANNGGLVAAPSFIYGTLSAESAVGVLQAIESDTNTKVLARPKVMTLDNESAIVRLSTNQAISFENTTDSDGNVTSEAVRETTGIVMAVTPQVNSDGFITMLVEPSITKTVTAEVAPPDGSRIVDPKTRSTRTLVRIQDGSTLVIGGLIDRSDDTTVRRVPILGRIPIIGKAFENTEVNNTSSELIVFVTPSIMKEDKEMRTAATSLVLPGVLPLAKRPAPAKVAQQSASDDADRSVLIDDALTHFEKRAEPKLSD